MSYEVRIEHILQCATRAYNDAKQWFDCDYGDGGYHRYVDTVVEQIKKVSEQFASAELASLKSRLPVNRDGDVVLEGMTQFYWCPHQKSPIQMKVSEVTKFDFETEWRVYQKGIQTRHNPRSLHTTSESCRGA